VQHALHVLEFDAVRRLLAGHCETSLGATWAEELWPVFEAPEVWRLQAETKEADDLLSGLTVPSLAPIRDVRRAVDIASKGSTLEGSVLYSVGASLCAMRSLRAVVQARSGAWPQLWVCAESLPDLRTLEQKILDSVEPDGEVLDTASPELGRLRRTRASCAQRIADRIQAYTTGKTRDLLSDGVFTQRDGRYVIPLKAENRGKIKGIVHDTSASGQTIFVEPEEIVQLGNSLREAEAAERAEVARILADLSRRIGHEATGIARGIEASGAIDLILAKARLGHAMHAVAPIESQGHRIFVDKARHPLLDPQIAVPLSLDVGKDFDGVLITGPNTGGKTVAIKTVGLFVAMAQSGLMLPASEVRLGPFSQIWADIGDEQSLQQSLSTFSGHIKNISEALRGLRPGAIVLLDELGAGTDPAEGAALAKAILRAFQKGGGKILASTHYGELKVFAYNQPGFMNAAMEFDMKSLRPTYRLILGAPGASHALRIAERYGISKEIAEEARGGLGVEQQDITRMLEKLEQAQRQAQRAQSDADRLSASLKKLEDETALKLAEADEIRRTARAKAAETLESTLRELRLEATEIFENLKSKGVGSKALEDARSRLKELQEVGADVAGEFRPEKRKSKAISLSKGDAVRVDGYTQAGTVLADPRDGKVQVQIGILKMTLPIDQLVPVPTATTKAPKAKSSLGFQKAQTASLELSLRGVRAEDAEVLLDRFLDDAILGGLPSVRIVHGKGEGILRKLTRDVLRRHAGVQSFRDGEAAEGGQGVTIATFKA